MNSLPKNETDSVITDSHVIPSPKKDILSNAVVAIFHAITINGTKVSVNQTRESNQINFCQLDRLIH